jgi:hypothetical protein
MQSKLLKTIIWNKTENEYFYEKQNYERFLGAHHSTKTHDLQSLQAPL